MAFFGSSTNPSREGKAEVAERRRPKYDSPYMERVNESDPLVDLLGPNSPAAKAFNGTKPSPACFDLPEALPGKRRLPSSLITNRLGAKMAFSVMGDPVASRLLIDVKIGGADVSRKHETRIEFYPGVDGHIENLGFEQAPSNSAADKGSQNGLIVHWKTRGGVTTGTGIDLVGFDDETKDTLAFMRELGQDASTSERIVRIFVVHTSGIDSALKGMMADVDHHPPWAHYSLDYTLPMSRRSLVHQKSGGLIRYPAKNSFASIAEARIMLGYGIALEYRYAPLKPPRHQWPGTEQVETYLRQQLRALMRCFNSDAERTIKHLWWPLILNQRADLLSARTPTSIVGLDRGAVKFKMLQVHQSFEWSEEQLGALSANQQFKGPLQILQGPPGSGKTQLLAGKSLFFALLGLSVLVISPTAPVAKAFAALLRKLTAAGALKDQGKKLKIIELFAFEPAYENLKLRGRVPNFAEANILITTPNFVCSEYCCARFGAKAPGIIVIHEESGLIPEPELFATLFCLNYHEKIQGLILSTDIREWPMDLATLTDPVRQIKRQEEKIEDLDHVFFRHFYDSSEGKQYNPDGIKKSGNLSFLYGQNEFADQLGLALVTRLLRQNFPSTRLNDQHRLNQSLLAFPSQRAYGCMSFSRNDVLTEAPPVETIPSDANSLLSQYKRAFGSSSCPTENLPRTTLSAGKFLSIIRNWLGPKVPGDCTRLFISTDNPQEGIFSECQKARGKSESKSNTRNVEVTMDLLMQNYKDGCPPQDVKVITPYADQLRRYEREFEKSRKQLGLRSHPFPEVRTVDSMRGHEAPIIIYDLVVTCGDGKHGIGIVAEEFRANIAATRATELFIILGSSEILTVFPSYWSELMKFRGTKEPLPYIVGYTEALRDEGLHFTAPTANGKKQDYIPPKECWKKDETVFEPAWEKTPHVTAYFDPGRGQ